MVKLYSFFNYTLTSFLKWIRVQTDENCCQFVFTVISKVFTSTSIEFPRKIPRETKTKTNCATVASFLWSVLSSAMDLDQSVREKSLSCYKM